MASIELFDPQLVIARLRDQVRSLKAVGGSADFAAAADDLKVSPAAYVIELVNQAPLNSTVGAVEQNVLMRFGVAIAVRDVSDARGEKAAATMRSVRKDVMTALLGWLPGADYDACEYAAGRLIALDAGMVVWWQDDYLTRVLQRNI